MIDFPPDIFLAATLEAGVVYYFQSDLLRTSTEPHYFVVVAKSETSILLTCATSKIEKRRRFVRLSGLPPSTLVEMQPNSANGIKTTSLFDCNAPVVETIASLTRKHAERPIRVRGRVTNDVLCALIAGMRMSPLVSLEVKRLMDNA